MDKRSIDVEKKQALEVFLESGIWDLRLCQNVSQKRRVHREHRDHAAKKYQRDNGQDDKYCSAKRVLLFFMVWERGGVCKIGRDYVQIFDEFMRSIADD